MSAIISCWTNGWIPPWREWNFHRNVTCCRRRFAVILGRMKRNSFIHFGALTLIIFSVGLFQNQIIAADFAATTKPVGRSTNGFITPVNQLVTPAGTLVELPSMRPQALALSPDGKLLVTAGITHELVVVDPANGKILQRVPLPSDQIQEESPVAAGFLEPDPKAQLSFTGLKFSPDGSRIYLANVNCDLKVFSVGKDRNVTALFSILLPLADALGRKADIPTGIAVSADGKKLYIALNLSNRLVELDAATGKILRACDVGVAPVDVDLGNNKIYASNWGGRRPVADSVTGPAGHGTLGRVGPVR